MLSMRYGIRGPALTLSCGSVSASTALQVALDQLAADTIDVALVAAAEAPVTRSVLALFGRARALSRRREGADRACRPFDAFRDGIVLGEGAAALVIVRGTDADNPLALVTGVAMTGDANSLLAPAEDGVQQARAIKEAMRRAGVSSDEVDYVSAHGTGTQLNDRAETRALKLALGEHARRVPISSSKSMFGHCLGACSALEIVKTVLCMRQGIIPATLNLEHPDPDCDLDYVPVRPRSAKIDVALVNNSSFGGRNACTVLRSAPCFD
jgi:3-oxoacyl-[acyl-carrier-protein] synthase II